MEYAVEKNLFVKLIFWTLKGIGAKSIYHTFSHVTTNLCYYREANMENYEKFYYEY